MVDPIRIERRSPTLDAVNTVALGKEQFGQIGAVLSRDAGNQRRLRQPTPPRSGISISARTLGGCNRSTCRYIRTTSGRFWGGFETRHKCAVETGEREKPTW